MDDFLAMPIKAKPCFHQQMAFDFACNKFDITTPCADSFSGSYRTCGRGVA